MLPLPWWILGTTPSDEEAENEETDYSFETQDTVPSTPVSIFKTPISTPLKEADGLPKVYDLPTFLKAAKRRSSTTLEEESSAKKQKSFPRNETEVMNKSKDGLSVLDDTFAILDAEYPETELLDKSDESLTDKSVLVDQGEKQCEELNSTPREYPMFFTSFDDTTVLFNSTITGDLDDADKAEKNAAVGDWVFKGNKMLEESSGRKVTTMKREAEPEEDQIFKVPVTSPKKKLPETPVKSSRGRKGKKDKEREEQGETAGTPKPVAVSRRKTPSRQAKTYKSLRGMF